jgi:flagellar motor switch protein FliM
MDKILSQDEIDALFATMKGGGEGAELASGKGPSSTKKIIPYDFKRPDRISKEQIRAIHLVHDYFSRNLSSSLSAYLRAFVEVVLVSVEQVSYSEFLQSLPEPTYFSSINMSPLNGAAALEINPSLIFPMIDMLLGGPGRPPKEEREITEIEQSVIEGVLKVVLRDLKEAWRPIVELSLAVDRTETKPQLLQIVAPSEAIVAIVFEIKVGDSRGTLNFGIPAIMLKMIKQNFTPNWSFRRKVSTTADISRIKELIQKVPVSVSADLPGIMITVEDLVTLSANDVIKFDHKVKEPVAIMVNGIPKFKGHIALLDGKRAVEVL